MFKRKNTIKVGMVAAIVALSVGLGACSSSDDDDGGDDTAIAVSYTHLPSPRDRQKARMPSSA